MWSVFPAVDLISAIVSFASAATNVLGPLLSLFDTHCLVGPTTPCPHPYVAVTASHFTSLLDDSR